MTEVRPANLGVVLRRAWVGYRRRLDDELAKAGFGDRGFPDGRVLAICSREPEVTISSVGRELGMTRQGASKLVASLRERGYVTLQPSGSDGREKLVSLTPRAREFLRIQHDAAMRIEDELAAELGTETIAALRGALERIGGEEQPRLRDYVSDSLRRGGSAGGGA